MGKPGKRPRAEKRARARQMDNLADKLERIALQSPGGAPDRPIRVDSAAVIELRALRHTCARCEGPLRLVDHQAEFSAGEQLRRVDLACERCFAKRTLWFVLGAAPVN